MPWAERYQDGLLQSPDSLVSLPDIGLSQVR